MKNGKRKGPLVWRNILILTVLLFGLLLSGCGRQSDQEEEGNNVTSENVVITETGEVIEKPVVESTPSIEETPTPVKNTIFHLT